MFEYEVCVCVCVCVEKSDMIECLANYVHDCDSLSLPS